MASHCVSLLRYLDTYNIVALIRSTMPHIYLLECKDDKYYVGRSSNKLEMEKRIKKHMRGIGCEWTKKYPAIKTIEVFNNADKFFEDAYTLKYMDQYGIPNVRGGTYSNPELEEYQINEIQEKIDGANDCCLRCGRTGHFWARCDAKTHANGMILHEEDQDEFEEDEVVDVRRRDTMAQGTVKWFNQKKAYGFIEWDEGPDLFFHKSEVEGTIEDGDGVEFEVGETDKGPNAVNVRKIED